MISESFCGIALYRYHKVWRAGAEQSAAEQISLQLTVYGYTQDTCYLPVQLPGFRPVYSFTCKDLMMTSCIVQCAYQFKVT